MQAGPGPDIRGAHSGSLARAPADVRASGLPCCPAPPSACLVRQFQDIIQFNTAFSMFDFVNHRQRGKHTMSISQARYLGGPGFSVPQAHAAVLGGRRELLAREVLQVPAHPPTPSPSPPPQTDGRVRDGAPSRAHRSIQCRDRPLAPAHALPRSAETVCGGDTQERLGWDR